MILGIGVDTVDIARFRRQLERTPALRPRLFTEAERTLTIPSLAVRFAAKEALIKALGDSGGLVWHDIEIVRNEDRAPSFVRTEGLSREFAARGADRAHLSLSHDGGAAVAFVVLEAGDEAGDAAVDPALPPSPAARSHGDSGSGGGMRAQRPYEHESPPEDESLRGGGPQGGTAVGSEGDR